MSKVALKLILALLSVTLALVLAGVAIAAAGNLVAYFQAGADPAAALNLSPNVPPDLHIAVRWQPDEADTGEPLGTFDRTEIESAYLGAWLQWNISYGRNVPYGLGGFFAGPALTQVEASVRRVVADGLHVAQTNLEHRPHLRFYAAGGALVAFRDEGARVVQLISDQQGGIVFAGETAARYDVVMVRDSGRWKIRSLVRLSGEVLGPPQGPALVAGHVQVAGTGLSLNGQPFLVSGINYYPQATPWARFWPEYDGAVVATDFSRIRALGLNTVRVFVPFEQFGGPDVKPAFLAKLGALLDRAQAADLHVIVTLFDFHTAYDPFLWPQADRHLETILTAYGSHPAVLAWDLKNEPDLDFARAGEATVTIWLAHTARLARELAPQTLLTIGWASATTAPKLANYVDVVSFHFYAPATELPTAYLSLRDMGRPVLLGEFGLPTWNSPFFPGGHSEAEQAVYYAAVLTAQQEAQGAGSLAWTLYDFTKVGPEVAGRWPWQTGPQRYLGVLRANGTPKAAAALLDPHATRTVAPLPGYARLLKPFWLTLAFGVAGTGGAFGGLWLWRRRKPKPTDEAWLV